VKKSILYQEVFNIKDLSIIVKKETQTIRSWEIKGIIDKPENKSNNGWREYSKLELASTLEKILNFNWKRKVIKNENEIQSFIDYLRGKITDVDIIGEDNE
jgi:hypothetical protein